MKISVLTSIRHNNVWIHKYNVGGTSVSRHISERESMPDLSVHAMKVVSFIEQLLCLSKDPDAS